MQMAEYFNDAFLCLFAINTFLFYRKKGKYMFYLSGLINLQKLNLSNCSFIFKESYFYDENNFNADIKIFSAMTNLTSLDLSGTDLRPWSNEKVFGNNTKLTELRIANNQITFITDTMLKTFQSLKILDMRKEPFLLFSSKTLGSAKSF